MQSCIYYIKNLINYKIYVGETIDYNYRFYKHKYELENNIHDNNHLQNAFNKYGEENFEFDIIIKIQECYLTKAEQYWMDYYKSYNRENGYNIIKNANRSNKAREDHPCFRFRVNLICNYCNNPYKVLPHKQDYRKYCSSSCSGKDNTNGKNNPSWSGGRVEIICKNCHEKFKVTPAKVENRKHCSRKCQAQNQPTGKNAHNWKGGKITKNCETCNNNFKHKKAEDQKYCSRECYHKRNNPEELDKVVR